MCVPAYSLSVLYGPDELNSPGLWDLDINYFRTKVRVHRSKHTIEMDDRESRYFEGMGTLLDIVDYAYRHVFNSIESISMMVDPSSDRSVITTNFTFEDTPFVGTLSYKITPDTPLGVFKVSAVPERDGNTQPHRVLTVPADQVLCYTENFPVPSELVRELTAAFRDLAKAV